MFIVQNLIATQGVTKSTSCSNSRKIKKKKKYKKFKKPKKPKVAQSVTHFQTAPLVFASLPKRRKKANKYVT